MSNLSDEGFNLNVPRTAPVNSQWEHLSFTGEEGHQKRDFITGSKFYGRWDRRRRCMIDYGVYKYPDGSTYRGYFSNGHFNGWGTVHLVEPYNMIFHGMFENGKLVRIDHVRFGDNLEVDATLENQQISFSNWTYCSKLDRRFAVERSGGIPPVGPTSHLTSGEPLHLENDEYDVGEGVFRASNGLLIKRPPPFPSFTFVNCANAAWIKEKCRVSACTKVDVNPNMCSKIIKNNQEHDIELEEYPTLCNYNNMKPNLNKFQQSASEASDRAIRNSSSDFKDVTSISSAEQDVLEKLATIHGYGKRVFGRRPEAESFYMLHRHSGVLKKFDIQM